MPGPLAERELQVLDECCDWVGGVQHRRHPSRGQHRDSAPVNADVSKARRAQLLDPLPARAGMRADREGVPQPCHVDAA